MTSAQVVQFFDARPLMPFTFTLTNGREVQVANRGQVNIGRYVMVVAYTHPTRQLEIFDVDHIVSIRTTFAADPRIWNG